MTAASGALRESLRLLLTRRFGTFWFASLLSNIGTWAQQVAEPWLLLSVGASSFLLGLDSFMMNAPVLLLTIAGGALADRADRRRVIGTFQSIQMLCPTLLVVLLLAGSIRPWIIIALSLVVGITDALSMPSFQSIVPSIVDRERIAQALALNSTQFNLSRILGPAIAGVLMTTVGAVGCFALSAASFVPFIGVAFWILPRAVPRAPSAESGVAGEASGGLFAILGDSHLRGALLTVLTTSSLCAPLMTFAPVLVKDVFHGDANRFSAAVGSFGIGGLLGAFLLLAVPPERDRRRLSSVCALCHGAVVILAGLNPWFWGLLPLLILAGAVMTASNIAANSLLQAAARPQLLGRTVSLFMLAMRGGLSIGSLVTGVTVGFGGVRAALVCNGVIAMLLQLGIGRAWFRSLPEREQARVTD
jgi:MFS family permease